MSKIILATSSLYRQKAFNSLGLDFTTQGSDVDEYYDGRPKEPAELVIDLAKLKAKDVAKKFTKGTVIGFDSVGWFNDEILEKPKSRSEAFSRLKRLSGNSHQFYTGIYVYDVETQKGDERVVITDVKMRDLTEGEINKYLDQDSSYKTLALGYNPQSYYSSTFVSEIKGSYNNLTRGIPLEVIMEMLLQRDALSL